jgi:hypothetical protein
VNQKIHLLKLAKIKGFVYTFLGAGRLFKLKDGTVTNFKVIKGLGYGLDESAINTIASKWRFKPGTRNGIRVNAIANFEVGFRL